MHGGDGPHCVASTCAGGVGEWTTMTVLGLGTGMRQGELLALRWEDGWIEFGKVESVWASGGQRFSAALSSTSRRAPSAMVTRSSMSSVELQSGSSRRATAGPPAAEPRCGSCVPHVQVSYRSSAAFQFRKRERASIPPSNWRADLTVPRGDQLPAPDHRDHLDRSIGITQIGPS